MKPFANRTAAGRELAALLTAYRGRAAVLILGLPRGGVPVAFEISRSLGLPLDVMIVRKLGAPGQPELALGAVASGGVTVMNEGLLRRFRDAGAVERTQSAERAELERRERAYRGDRAPLDARNLTLILVDDGAATGASMVAAVRASRKLGANRVIVALPVASTTAHARLRKEADEVICLHTPTAFYAVGQWYADFTQTTDEDVTDLLVRAANSSAAPGGAADARGATQPTR